MLWREVLLQRPHVDCWTRGVVFQSIARQSPHNLLCSNEEGNAAASMVRFSQVSILG